MSWILLLGEMTYIQLMPFPSNGRFLHVQYMPCVHFFSSVMTVDLMTGLISTGIHYRKPCVVEEMSVFD